MGYCDQEDLIELFESWEEDRYYEPPVSRAPVTPKNVKSKPENVEGNVNKLKNYDQFANMTDLELEDLPF